MSRDTARQAALILRRDADAMSLRAHGYRKRRPVRINVNPACAGGTNPHLPEEQGATGVVIGVRRRPPAQDGHEVFVILDCELWRPLWLPHWPIAGPVGGRWYRLDEVEAY